MNINVGLFRMGMSHRNNSVKAKSEGDTAVEAAFPQEHLPLLRHLQRRMRKRQLRELLCNAALQKGTKITLTGKRKVSRSGTATDDGAGDTAAAVRSKGPTSVYLQELLDAAEATDLFRKPGGKKRTRCQAGAMPVSLVEDSAGDTPVDLLSPAAAERVLLSRCMLKRRRQGALYVDGRAAACEGAARHTDALAAKEEVYWNEEGRLVVLDDEEGRMKRTGKRLPSGAKAEPDTKERTLTRLCARDKPTGSTPKTIRTPTATSAYRVVQTSVSACEWTLRKLANDVD
eukprot:XP_028340499.1 uncharacterized protein LOC114484928 [Physeter catodon]